MDASEYIDAVTGQMRCKRARAMVAKELSDHISDQTESYLREGMSPLTAAEEAVRQMGDAVEVGTEMDRLHRPRMDKKTLIIVGVFSFAAMFLQTAIVQVMRSAGDRTVSMRIIPFQVLAGVLIMIGILYLDYSILGKYPMVLWAFLIALPICSEFIAEIYLQSRFYLYLLLGLFLPSYVGLLYHYRSKRWGGFLCSVLWLLAGVFVYMRCCNRGLAVLMVGFAAELILTYALGKGWYGISKRLSIALLWVGTLGGAVLAIIGGSNVFAVVRLKRWLSFYGSLNEYNYITIQMRDAMKNFTLFGQGGSWSERPAEGAMSFFLVLFKTGILPGALVLIGFAALFFCMAAGVSKQKNILGSMLGLACILGLVIPTVGHILSNLTLIPYAEVYIPFLYPGWLTNAVSYTLLGLYLSVYRNTDIVA